MTVLLLCVAFLTLTVCGPAAVIAIRTIRERRKWRRMRKIRPILILGQAQDDEVSDVATCLQVWLDERWNERFG